MKTTASKGEEAESSGAEIEFAAQPNKHFDFAVSASYTDSELKSTLTSTDAMGNVSVVSGITYFPRSSVRAGALVDSATTSLCPWKGTARYWHVEGEERVATDAAFAYERPWPLARRLVTDRVAFWREVEIVEGLEEGEKVALADPSKPQEERS